MLPRVTSRLYLNIWLVLMATVVLLTLSITAVWKYSHSSAPLATREVIVHNKLGELIGTAQTSPGRRQGEAMKFAVETTDGQTLHLLLPRPQLEVFIPWVNLKVDFSVTLIIVALIIALALYPVIRRLTLRLEALTHGVKRWGVGDLSARVNIEGKDEVAFLAAHFNQGAARIEALLKSHTTLLANASHELRSPLARIRISLELIDDAASTVTASPGSVQPNKAELDTNTAINNLKTVSSSAAKDEIKRSIMELEQLIDEILLASRLDALQANVEPFETLDLTGLAAEECARVNAELNALYKTECGSTGTDHSLMIEGSSRLLRRLMRNLLENARRYSSGEISLDLQQIHQDNQTLAVIKVNDHGPGVPQEFHDRIFEPFYRLPGASERDGCVGLGLALVKSISHLHGGSVRCHTRPGGGASFIVELPMFSRA